MRMSQLFFQTLREAPAEARAPGYQLLLRGGYIRPVHGGFAWLPMGTSVRLRVEDAISRLLSVSGGQLVALPLVRPAEDASGPAGEHSARFRDRTHHEMVYGGGREAPVLAVAAGLIRSYRQLPLLLYEGWQQFRDREGAALAGGLLGAREGRVLDAYGLYHDAGELAAEYAQVCGALSELFELWDLGALEVIGGEDGASLPPAHAMVYPAAEGERGYARCPSCGYAADLSAARVTQEPPAPEALLPTLDVETPDCKTIADLAGFLGIPASRTAKVVFLVAAIPRESDRFVIAVVRGDTALNEARLKSVLGAASVGPATEAEIRQAGAEPGYGSPLGLAGVTVVVDTLAARSPNLVAGANRPGYHTLNVNLGRDYRATAVAEIAAPQEGSPCPRCGSPVVMGQGIALAEAWQAGERLSCDLDATYLDSTGRSLPLALGRYRIYIDRVLAVLAERHHDGSGLVWPAAVAPYRVHLMTVGKVGPEVNAAAERVYADLAGAGIDVLFDDRDERAGVKFNDADLLGAPWRVAVGERGLQSGAVEVKARSRPDVRLVALDQLVSLIAGNQENSVYADNLHQSLSAG
jgi:prolyl-tRNA synthetase